MHFRTLLGILGLIALTACATGTRALKHHPSVHHLIAPRFLPLSPTRGGKPERRGKPVTLDEAVAWSSQRFVREITQPGQRPRVRISSVVHEQRFRRNGQAWVVAGPIQEHNQTARWADEAVSP